MRLARECVTYTLYLCMGLLIVGTAASAFYGGCALLSAASIFTASRFQGLAALKDLRESVLFLLCFSLLWMMCYVLWSHLKRFALGIMVCTIVCAIVLILCEVFDLLGSYVVTWVILLGALMFLCLLAAFEDHYESHTAQTVTWYAWAERSLIALLLFAIFLVVGRGMSDGVLAPQAQPIEMKQPVKQEPAELHVQTPSTYTVLATPGDGCIKLMKRLGKIVDTAWCVRFAEQHKLPVYYDPRPFVGEEPITVAPLVRLGDTWTLTVYEAGEQRGEEHLEITSGR
jgi:hypothetical protein